VPWATGLAAEDGKEIYAMRFWDSGNATTPSVLTNNCVLSFDWDVDKLFEKIGR
jgi:hypothetical protein